jgi:sarcosine oxidase
MATYDVVVVGLGAMGSAAAYHLSRNGARVLGIDQFAPPHAFGSSTGDTRITRTAVAEGSAYVPLVQRSHELWRELEARTGLELFVQCGGLVMGVPDSTGQHGIDHFAAATREVAVAHGIPHEVLGPTEIKDRFGVFDVTDEIGCFEPTAGYLLAASCIAAHLGEARRLGAEIHTTERVLAWSSNGTSVVVDTDRGAYDAASMVVAAGPWVPRVLPELASIFSVQRQVQFWFDAGPKIKEYRALPIYIWMHGAGPGDYLYGFPARASDGVGVKVATEVMGDATTPEGVDRTVGTEEVTAMHARHVAGRFVGLSATCTRSAVCLYTVTPDFGFVIDVHPEHGNVIIASPCSGHGFKHSAAVGECVAQMAVGARPDIDLAPFSIRRFG